MAIPRCFLISSRWLIHHSTFIMKSMYVITWHSTTFAKHKCVLDIVCVFEVWRKVSWLIAPFTHHIPFVPKASIRSTCINEGGIHVHTEVREGGGHVHTEVREGGGHVHTEVREGDMCTQR